MKKVITAAALSMALLFSVSTSVFAADQKDISKQDQIQIKKHQAMLEMDANDAEKINEVLKEGLSVSNENKTEDYVFPDGSVITLHVDVVPTDSTLINTESTSAMSVAAATSTPYTATVSISAQSSVLGTNMWTYTLSQNYQSNGTSVTWYEAVPNTTFDKPFYSLWSLDSELAGITTNPGYPGGIWTISSIKCSFGVWEVAPQVMNAKLTLSIR